MCDFTWRVKFADPSLLRHFLIDPPVHGFHSKSSFTLIDMPLCIRANAMHAVYCTFISLCTPMPTMSSSALYQLSTRNVRTYCERSSQTPRVVNRAATWLLATKTKIISTQTWHSNGKPIDTRAVQKYRKSSEFCVITIKHLGFSSQ